MVSPKNKKNRIRIYDELVKFITTNQDNLYRLAYSYVKNQQEALDIVQDSIYKALSSADTLKSFEYIKTWVYRIVINTSITYIRKKKYTVVSDKIEIKFDNIENDLEQNIDLYDAIDRLSEKEKTVVVLKYFEDMKFDEIARVTQCNINTLKSRLYSAINKLRIIIDGKG